jgi:hypothetical protein
MLVSFAANARDLNELEIALLPSVLYTAAMDHVKIDKAILAC